jgi:endonuclease-3
VPSQKKATEPQRVRAILKGLAEAYPRAACALVHHSAWELLVATILSAQCTDARVNLVTPGLFRKYPGAREMAALQPEELEPEIRSTGFYRNKAKSIVGAAQRIMKEFGGEVPADMDELLTLPGVARKTANVVLGVWFHQAGGIVVDTHMQRVSQRLDLTRNEAPEKIEQDLMKLVPKAQWVQFSHRVIAHGRQVCVARKPHCAQCAVEPLCYAADKTV